MIRTDKGGRMDTNRSEHLRKMVTGACLIAAPLVFVVSESIHPDDKTNATDEVAVIAGGLDRWYTAHALEIVGIALMVGAVLGLAHLLHERSPGYAVVGGGLALIGLVMGAACFGTEGFGSYYLVKHAPRAAAIAAYDDMFNGARIIPFFAASLLISVGLVVLAVQLWRTRVVASWQAGAIALGAVAVAASGPSGTQALSLAGMVVLFIGLAPIGYMVLTESDAEWAHTPEFHGFSRPAMGAAH
jgi:hypothetical protein